jgi:citrate lyase subunit beta/citryl-CoA lyase
MEAAKWVLRTYLVVPGTRAERFAKALASGADAVILDLENVVARDAKVAPRNPRCRGVTSRRRTQCAARRAGPR